MNIFISWFIYANVDVDRVSSEIFAESQESLRSTNPDVQECIQISAVSCESSNSLSDGEFQSCDAAKVYDDKKYPTSVLLLN